MGRVLDVINSDEVEWLRSQIYLFAESSMLEYLDECKKKCQNVSLKPTNTKNFYDSVWGTIEIKEGEIFILDSPILQRLRHIKQLGMADLLYSSATHTRFSHTLGVLQTADVMAGHIEKELNKKNAIYDKEIRQLIRLAAIFHDCGHMFGSHASEMYFQRDRSSSLFEKVENVRAHFKLHLGIRPSLSEVISILLVTSPSIYELLNIIQFGLDLTFERANQNKIIEKICCMILGFPYSESMIPFAQVISGQIDSDKLDYLKRDSHSTGVPIAVDMSRVFQKLRVVATNKSYTMIANSEKRDNPIYKIAIAPAAINTIDQLVISRYMMFENIYYHQKTLTAEEMLRYAMRKIDCATSGILDDFSRILCLIDSNVVNSDFYKAILSVNNDINILKKDEFLKACKILKYLYKRQLFKRCVAFTDYNLTKVLQKDKDFYSRIISGGVIEEQEQFLTDVTEEVKRIKIILSDSEFHFNEDTDVLFLIAPGVSSTSINSNITIDDKSKKERNMEFESDNWLQSRASRKSQNYLVSYAEDRYLVYIATEVVLFRTYGLLNNEMVIFSDDDEEYLNKLKLFLDKNSYFDKNEILAPDNAIRVYESELLLLVEKWKSYEIFDVNSGMGFNIDITYLSNHIKQYIRFRKELGDFDVFLKGYIKMLSIVEIVSKEIISKAFISNFNLILKEYSQNIILCNIGSLQDGSAVISYHVNMLNQKFEKKWKTHDLTKVLNSEESELNIVFMEDAFCSGKQILSIFETYMGIPINQRQTKEVHVSELSTELREKLKQCNLIFSFIYYEEKNEEYFRRRLAEIGLTKVEIVSWKKFPKGYFKHSVNDDEKKEKEIVQKYLKKAGELLVKLKATNNDGNIKDSWDDERIEQSVLGYNDAQQLVVFSWNTPTYTITPLWLKADRVDYQWIPLFPRIDK